MRISDDDDDYYDDDDDDDYDDDDDDYEFSKTAVGRELNFDLTKASDAVYKARLWVRQEPNSEYRRRNLAEAEKAEAKAQAKYDAEARRFKGLRASGRGFSAKYRDWDFKSSAANEHVLYRFFNRNGELLYIGMTGRPMARFGSHRTTQSWWSEVTRIELERFSTRHELAQAEANAISYEAPKYNVTYRSRLDD